MTSSKAYRRDVASEITETIVARLESGVPPWLSPWSSARVSTVLPRNAATGESYRGVNVMLLWVAATEGGYADARWVTFKQAKALGGGVRRGEKGTTVVYWRREGHGPAGGSSPSERWFCRTYHVFNVEQCDGLGVGAGPAVALSAPGTAERIAAENGARIVRSEDDACFSVEQDLICMPAPERFESGAAAEATLLHELTHWTGHPTRLDRRHGERFGNEAHAFEELVAELGAAFLGAELGIEGRLRHAEYRGRWARILDADRHAIFTACRLAFQAVALLID